jgi:hypothetical protein
MLTNREKMTSIFAAFLREVPEGLLNIARRFIAGWLRQERPVPNGTVEVESAG